MKTFHALLMIFALAGGAQASIITLHSGNGGGANDTLISFLDGPNSTDFGSAFTGANFIGAQTGPKAFIINPNGAWIGSLVEDAGAKWIGTNAGAGGGSGDTALYAMSFTLASPVVSASIALHYATDNGLGGSNPGLYLNGTAVSPAPPPSSFSTDNSYTNNTIGSLLTPGTNWIYFDAVNLGGPAGIIFTATITTVDASSVPEPASLLLFAPALLVLGGARYRRLRRS